MIQNLILALCIRNNYKLLFHPDLYFGEAYTDGSLVIENGTLTEFLDIAMKNIGRGETNLYAMIIKKIRGTFRYLTNYNLISKINYIQICHRNLLDSAQLVKFIDFSSNSLADLGTGAGFPGLVVEIFNKN